MAAEQDKGGRSLRKLWLRFRLWLDGLFCRHKWRPAITSKGPARHCYFCGHTEKLTEAEFYAQFGRMPIL